MLRMNASSVAVLCGTKKRKQKNIINDGRPPYSLLPITRGSVFISTDFYERRWCFDQGAGFDGNPSTTKHVREIATKKLRNSCFRLVWEKFANQPKIPTTTRCFHQKDFHPFKAALLLFLLLINRATIKYTRVSIRTN